MTERAMYLGLETYAVINDDSRTVYYQRHETASKVVPAKRPGGYEPPQNYREIDAPRQWAKANAGYVV